MEEDEIKVLSTEDIYTSLLTPEDHYTELNPAIVPNIVPCNNHSNAQNQNSINNMIPLRRSIRVATKINQGVNGE